MENVNFIKWERTRFRWKKSRALQKCFDNKLNFAIFWSLQIFTYNDHLTQWQDFSSFKKWKIYFKPILLAMYSGFFTAPECLQGVGKSCLKLMKQIVESKYNILVSFETSLYCFQMPIVGRDFSYLSMSIWVVNKHMDKLIFHLSP